MSGRQEALYRVERLGTAPDDETPLWGVRRPNDTWVQSMGKPAWYIGRGTAERDAAELNQIHGLASDS
ncbi:hypothetical protein [Kitasatospora cineracea]|uniref:Uncharacterized protein n=1 Tax=Kitasatospora cineracea TaxID=88074 RepID=A0A3N4RM57_9ACTN|nr:hypothetical protein [Kitasatospora cineracea]RPE32229.1 hypothetical protein EDD38_0476 [Kitasatospora cineracea]